MPKRTETGDAFHDDLIERRVRLSEALAESESPRLRGLLDEVDAALAELDQGSYGICGVCNDSIGDAQLAAYPLLRFCLEHLTPEEQRVLQDDLDLAARIQSRLLPERKLRYAGWDVYYHYEPAGPVGGDYCDLIQNSGDLYFFVGDASGKGVAASMLTAQLHGLFRTLVMLDLPLDSMLERANRVFFDSVLQGHYATLVCGRAAPSGVIEMINAGHPAPLVLRNGAAVPVDATGQPLGLFETVQYDVRMLELAPNDSLLIYSDGLSEARDPGSKEYGSARAAQLAAARAHLEPEPLVHACLTDLATFRADAPRTDDLTLMALRRLA